MGGFRNAPVVLAAFAQRHLHEWLPGKAHCNFETFRSTLIQANVTRVAFLRHGQTAPSQGSDFDRILTEEGRQQGREAGSSFGVNLKPFYPTMLSSPAPRTIETAKIFLESSNNDESEIQVVTDQVLYDGTMQPKGSPLFQKLGYAPLNDYLNHQEEQFRLDAQFVLGAYAHSVVDAIMSLVGQHDVPESVPNSTLWMVGHAIYLPAAALGVASLSGCKDCDIILSMNTLPAEGYLIDVERQKASYLSRLTSAETK